MSPDLDRIPAPWLARFKALGRCEDPAVKAVVLVGGCVRDMLLGKAPFDWDVMVEGSIEPVLSQAGRHFRVEKVVRHPAFLTSTVHFDDGAFLDVVTARTETYPKPASLPQVTPAPLADDFRRRDFTVNALARHITPAKWGTWEDPCGGREDVEKGLIRVLHDRSFVDDPTRIPRAARYAGRYGWTVEPRTLDLIRKAVREGRPAFLSPARLRNELTHLLREPDAGPALKLLHDWGFWRFWSPAWRWTPALSASLSAPSGDPLPARLAALCRSGDFERSLRDLKALSYPSALLRSLPVFGPEIH